MYSCTDQEGGLNHGVNLLVSGQIHVYVSFLHLTIILEIKTFFSP